MIRGVALSCALAIAAPCVAQTAPSVFNPVPATVSGTSTTLPQAVYQAGRWYIPLGYGQAAGSSLSTGTIYFLPFIVQRGGTISSLGVQVTTLAAGGNVQLSIYAANATTNAPTGTPVAGCSVSVASTASVTCTVSFGSGVVSPGLYWQAVELDASASTVVRMAAAAYLSSSFNVAGANSATRAYNGAFGTDYGSTSHPFVAGTYADVTSATFSANGGSPAVPLIAFSFSSVQ